MAMKHAPSVTPNMAVVKTAPCPLRYFVHPLDIFPIWSLLTVHVFDCSHFRKGFVIWHDERSQYTQ